MKLFALDFARPDFEAISKNPVDVLINTAAIQGPIGAFIDNDWESFEETLKINLLSPIALIKACLPQMIKNQYENNNEWVARVLLAGWDTKSCLGKVF